MRRMTINTMAALLLFCGAAWADESVDRTIPASAAARIEIENVAGSIEVTGWDRNEVHIVGTLGDDVEGLDITDLSRSRLAAWRSRTIGYIFQRCHLIQGLTALDNVMMTALLQGQAPRDAETLAFELLTAVGMEDFRDSLSTQMSLGQCQRVAVARALAGQPRVLLADEPTASLDHRNGEEVISLIRKVGKQANRAAIVVTHDPRIFPFADRVLWVENGQVHDHNETATVQKPSRNSVSNPQLS